MQDHQISQECKLSQDFDLFTGNLTIFYGSAMSMRTFINTTLLFSKATQQKYGQKCRINTILSLQDKICGFTIQTSSP